MEDILFEITPCPLSFPVCIFFWVISCNSMRFKFFMSSPDPSLIFRLVYPAAFSTSLLRWLIGFSKLPRPKHNISFGVTGKKKSSEISTQTSEPLLLSLRMGCFCPHGNVAIQPACPHCAAPYTEGTGWGVSHSFGSKSSVLTGLQAGNRFPLFGCHGIACVTAFITPHGCRNICLHRGLLINHLWSGLCGRHEQEILTVWLEDTWSSLYSKNTSLSSPTIFCFLPHHSCLLKRNSPCKT